MKMRMDGPVMENMTLQVSLGPSISQFFQGTWFLMWTIFFFEVAIDTVCKVRIKKYVDMDVVDRDRDFFLCKKDVVNIQNRLMKRNYQLNKKDEKSVNLCYEKHKDDFFFYQKPNGGDVPFIAGIQTKWMLDTMVRLLHNSIIAMDSTFNTNKYGVSVLPMTDLV